MRTPADVALALLDTGEWNIVRNLPSRFLSAEDNERCAWTVSRAQAPLFDSQNRRTWSGPTAHAALGAAHVALEREMPPVIPGSLTAVQFGLYFSVGPALGEDDETNSARQTRSYNALTAILIDRAMDELSVSSAGLTWVPVSLLDCNWDGQDIDGQVVYSVHFQSEGQLDPTIATKLRAMALEAYTKVCGADARFIRAELYQQWSYSQHAPYTFDE
jgi:hypothetical protein